MHLRSKPPYRWWHWPLASAHRYSPHRRGQRLRQSARRWLRARHADERGRGRALVSFTLETDGRLPSGQTLRAAIAEVERATDRAPAYYMINCAHPSHFEGALEPAGDPAELGAEHRALRLRYPHIKVLGGCCGTDDRHIACIGAACAHAA
jgi:S-methylmethionine-dependent homocysteine/selenocysteine methylase